jgi:secernin
MCDTMVALGNSTADGSVIFAKNSDREPNEAHEVIIVPAAQHGSGEMVKCTYIEIPQVEHTNAVLLAKPFWIWGSEMGANEKGVVIGNEAVFSKVPYEKSAGLLGMDFIRLALERADNAYDALRVIVDLLDTHGQGGNCGFEHKLFYHNSFIIADRSTAWVLETAGRHWAAERVRDVRSISNGLTIETEWDLASDGLVDFAVDQGWCKGESDFNFRKCFTDFLFTTFSDSRKRQDCTMDQLKAEKGRISPGMMMKLLRSHHSKTSTDWTPDRALSGADVCMHASAGPIRVSQTTGSMVSHLSDDLNTHWVTATSAPCTGIFKPVWIDSGIPDTGPTPTGRFNSESLWWRHEILHREVLRNYALRLGAYNDDRDKIEIDFQAGADQNRQSSLVIRRMFSKHCFELAHQKTSEWLTSTRTIKIRPQRFYYQMAWRAFNKKARIDL